MKPSKLTFLTLLLLIGLLSTTSCKKKKKMNFSNAKIAVSFGNSTRGALNTVDTKQTPAEYIIALHSAKMLGEDGTDDHPLFAVNNFEDAHIYNFTSGSAKIDLSGGKTIPEGNYNSFELGIYYLQMKIQIFSVTRGVEWRNLRIYFCEDGIHKRGDVIQVSDDGSHQGWLFGENQVPDFDPVSPRINAYTYNSDGINWYQFGGYGKDFGPFASPAMWNFHATPFTQHAPFTFEESDGRVLVIDFDVTECWQFQDVSGDGYWGGDDLGAPGGTAWHMKLPTITLRIES